MEATALLLNWKRPDNLKRIIATLRAQTAKVEIFVWNNSPGLAGAKADWVIDSSRNVMCGSRWAMALFASSPYVFSLDDDLMPADDNVIADCIARMKENTCDAIGYQGVTLGQGVSYLRGRHQKACAEDDYVDVIKGRFLFTRTERACWALGQMPHDLTLNNPSLEDDIVVSSCVERKVLPAFLRRRFRELPAPFSLCGRPNHYELRQNAVDRYIHEQ